MIFSTATITDGAAFVVVHAWSAGSAAAAAADAVRILGLGGAWRLATAADRDARLAAERLGLVARLSLP